MKPNPLKKRSFWINLDSDGCKKETPLISTEGYISRSSSYIKDGVNWSRCGCHCKCIGSYGSWFQSDWGFINQEFYHQCYRYRHKIVNATLIKYQINQLYVCNRTGMRLYEYVENDI